MRAEVTSKGSEIYSRGGGDIAERRSPGTSVAINIYTVCVFGGSQGKHGLCLNKMWPPPNPVPFSDTLHFYYLRHKTQHFQVRGLLGVGTSGQFPLQICNDNNFLKNHYKARFSECQTRYGSDKP